MSLTNTTSQLKKALSFALSHSGESTTEDYETAKAIIQKRPGLARERLYRAQTNDDEQVMLDLPLHAFANKRIGKNWTQHMELMKLFFNAFPGAIECTSSSSGMLPLHKACQNGLHPRIIMYMLKKFPGAAMQKDARGGWPPLAYYVINPNPHKTIVNALVKAAPETIEYEYDYDGDANEQPSREAEMPAPLFIASSRNCKLDVLEIMIPTNPKSCCLKVELPYGHLPGTFGSEQSELLATRVSSWLKILQLDGRWFKPQALVIFLSKLAEEKPRALTRIDLSASSNHFQQPKVLRALTKLIRQAPNLDSIHVRKPFDGSGPRNDDDLIMAIANGLDGSTTAKEMCFAVVRGKSFAGFGRILSSCERLGFSRASFTPEGIASLVRGTQKTPSLSEICFDTCNMPKGGMNHVLEALSNCRTLETLLLDLPRKGSLPALARLTNLTSLQILANADGNFYKPASAKPVLDLMDASPNLKRLELAGFRDIPMARFCQVLKRNHVLKYIRIQDCKHVHEIGQAIVRALADSNSTLCNVEISKGEHGELLPCMIQNEMLYYLALNLLGRGRVMRPEASTVNDLVEVLTDVSAPPFWEHGDIIALYYGILRECPSLWAGRYTEVADDDSLAQAVEQLSLHDDEWLA